MQIREEAEADAAIIGSLITDAFRTAPYASGREAEIVARLREAGALTFGLAATEEGAIVGYIAFSPVGIDGADRGWFALGPIAVHPDRQGGGIGAALILEGLDWLVALGGQGCILVGDPAYYGRFGFHADRGLWMAGVPAENVLSLPLGNRAGKGEVAHHCAFFPA